jgi:serine/threonine protein kinase
MKTCPQCGGSFEPALKFCPRDGQVLNDADQDLVGRVLDGQYEIEALVASGGMGAVYRARHILLGDRVAIKVLLPEFRSNPEWLRRFQREGQAARRFSHPNAVAVYDLRTSSDGLVYMVMEFVEGVPLDVELRQRGRYSPAEALEVLEPVGRVLEAAHGQGVVHRDLKPANVMVKRLADGGVWVELLDLGIAKLADFKDTSGDGSPLTVAGQMLGTPYYMSPEQWGEPQRDGSPEIDGRADTYSLGLMFYELVSGSRPFEAKTLVELRLFHAAINPKRLDLAVPGVPEDFGRAVERAMAKDRGDRYTHAAAFIEDLRAALGQPAPRAAGARAAAPAPRAPQADARKTTPAVSLTQSTLNATPRPPVGSSARARDLDDSAVPVIRPDGARDSTPTQTLLPNVRATPNTPVTPNVPTPLPAAQATTDAPTSVQAAPTNARAAPANAPAAPVQSQPAAESSVVVPPADRVARGATSSRGKSRALLVALIVGLLLFACVGVAGVGWFLWSRWQQARIAMLGAPPASAGDGAANASGGANGAKTPGARVEALSYWIEAFDGRDQKEGTRVAQPGALALASGQQFKFHFSPATRGFLYVIGPGERNAPTTFLTPEPAAGLLKTNLAAANADFAFPYGAGQVLQLDRNPGTEEFTVIFSETPLLEPKFLAARGGHALTPAELKQLEDLRARAKTAAPAQDVKQLGGAPAVAVTVQSGEGSPGLVVFDVRIEHR